MSFNWERSPTATSPISAVLPAHQAEKTLSAVTESLLSCLERLEPRRECEIIIVNDGSSDGTRNAAEELAARHPAIRCLHHEKSQGYGAALRTGLAAAQFPLLFTIPADGSYQAADLPRLLGLIDQVDIVSGFRRQRPRIKAQFQGWLAFLVFGLWFKDAACHMRLYRRSIFPRIPIQSNGCFADVEILAKANFLNCLITEIDVGWTPPAERVRGPAALTDALRVFRKPDFGPPQVAVSSE